MAASLNPYISTFGEEFDAEKSSHYRLTIQFALGGLSYALLDTTTQTLVALECYQSDLLSDSGDLFRTLERALEAKGLNNKGFEAVTCLADNRLCTLVPNAVFDDAEKNKYLEFAFQIPEGYTIIAEPVKAASCHNVTAWPKALQDKLAAKWPNALFTHTSSVFIDSVMRAETANGVFLLVRNRDFDMVIKKEGKLLFFNNFKFNTKDDFAYFMLFAMEQYGLSGQDTPVCFSGLIRPASEIIDLCGRYVKDLSFAEYQRELSVSKALKEVPFQYYYIHYQTFTKQTIEQRVS